MVDRLKRSPNFRPLAALLWTVGLGALLFGIDRALLGPPAPTGWVTAETLEAVPDTVGPMVVPNFLPDRLAWPPSRVIYRLTGGPPGWWLGLGPAGSREIHLWLGAPAADAGAVVGPPASCLAPRGACPPGWQARRAELEGVGSVLVLGTLPPDQLDRIAANLQAGARELSVRRRPGADVSPP